MRCLSASDLGMAETSTAMPYDPCIEFLAGREEDIILIIMWNYLSNPWTQRKKWSGEKCSNPINNLYCFIHTVLPTRYLSL